MTDVPAIVRELAQQQRSGAASAATVASTPRTSVRMSDVVDGIMALRKLPVMSTPFANLNAKLHGGFRLHDITNIIAGTGKGKSSLACELAAHHARTAPVVYYVGEMTPELIAARIIGQRAGRPWTSVLDSMDPSEMRAVLADLQLYAVPRSPTPVEDITKALDEIALYDGHRGVPMVIIDYVQLLADASRDVRSGMIAAVRGVKNLILERDVIGIVLSQSSRTGAKKIRDGVGESEELGDTGAESAELENSATNTLVLSYATKDGANVHDVQVHITKCRFGGTSKIGLRFTGATGRWEELARAPLLPAETERRKGILENVDRHEQGRCHGSGATCARALSKNSFSLANGPHWIKGSKSDVGKTLDAMIAEGILVAPFVDVDGRSSGSYRRAPGVVPG